MYTWSVAECTVHEAVTSPVGRTLHVPLGEGVKKAGYGAPIGRDGALSPSPAVALSRAINKIASVLSDAWWRSRRSTKAGMGKGAALSTWRFLWTRVGRVHASSARLFSPAITRAFKSRGRSCWARLVEHPLAYQAQFPNIPHFYLFNYLSSIFITPLSLTLKQMSSYLSTVWVEIQL